MPGFTLHVPADYSLPRDFCSYGYFLLFPNHWSVREQALRRPLRLSERVVGVRVTQPRGEGAALRVETSHTLSRDERDEAHRQLARMLRLDESEASIAVFHRLDPRWARTGQGRVSRSPTLFEDVVKTVTSCNVTWPGTVQMNRRLCEVLGTPLPEGGAWGEGVRTFPDAAKLARARPQTLRARCRVGYRDQRLVELARLFRTPPAKGGLDVARLEDPATPDEAVREVLLGLPGVGPYAAANIMQLLGRYAHLPLDTESVRHGRSVLGYRGTTAQVMKRLKAHYAPFGAQAFRSYWLELWTFYESKHGPAWTWERDSTGKMFTAALLSK
ncbi:MAG: hypothetical protein HBSAPP03_18780 [Phycisphaerae bacterium]|nr:MAG: hypothetical protein HBSAPP03_18780 [Phycisphaerae bacterium]